MDSSGKVVTTTSSRQQIDASKTVTFNPTTPAISNPAAYRRRGVAGCG